MDLKDIEKYYTGDLKDSFLTNSNDTYNAALEDKRKFSAAWLNFINKVKAISEVAKVRDLTASAHQHSNKATIGLKDMSVGVTLGICYLPRLIGFYFCDYNNDAAIPIFDHSGKQKHLSYFPVNKDQILFTQTLIELLKDEFSGFEVFNNFYADRKVDNVIVDLNVKGDIDCFQVLFDHNMVGII